MTTATSVAPAGKQPRIRDLDDPNFDPFLADELMYGDELDIYSLIHRMAEENWIHPGEFRHLFGAAAALPKTPNHFMALGYDKCAEILLNPEVFSSEPLRASIGISFGETISYMDPPDHTRYRRIFQKAFLPQTVRKWAETIVQPVIEGLLDKVMDRGTLDLVQDFTIRYPFQVIYRQLKLPPEDILVFHKLAAAQGAFFFEPSQAIDAGRKLGEYFTPLIRDWRRRSPDEGDLISLLAHAEADGEVLPEQVVVSFLRQLTTAAGDTTYRGTSNLMVGLLTNPDQLKAVREDRSLVTPAIEEALRWEGPVTHSPRMATRDFEMHGFTFRKGDTIDLVQASASRDPDKFPDPDRFDIHRSRQVRHMAFATGPHVCIGQHLARVEMERALNAILDRLPRLRFDPDKPPPEIRGVVNRAPKHVYARFD